MGNMDFYIAWPTMMIKTNRATSYFWGASILNCDPERDQPSTALVGIWSLTKFRQRAVPENPGNLDNYYMYMLYIMWYIYIIQKNIYTLMYIHICIYIYTICNICAPGWTVKSLARWFAARWLARLHVRHSIDECRLVLPIIHSCNGNIIGNPKLYGLYMFILENPIKVIFVIGCSNHKPHSCTIPYGFKAHYHCWSSLIHMEVSITGG